MKYLNFNIFPDNSFYTYGQHAVRLESECQIFWFDNFAAAIKFARAVRR
jgi:hypothetical protein